MIDNVDQSIITSKVLLLTPILNKHILLRLTNGKKTHPTNNSNTRFSCAVIDTKYVLSMFTLLIVFKHFPDLVITY